MKIFNRQNNKILERIVSLEDHLGVKYSPASTKDDYSEHFNSEYGVLVAIKDEIKDIKEKLFDKKEK